MTSDNLMANDHDYERVRPGCECPQCGEDDIDSLVWIDDAHVRCDNCGHIYQAGQRDQE